MPITRYWYWRTPWRLLTLLTFLSSQVSLFFNLLGDRRIDRDAVLYVNTLLPFGAALYGKLTNRRVIYHLHEVSVSPAPLRWFLTAIARVTASDLVYVSDFHRHRLPISGVRSHTVYNALDAKFFDNAGQHVYQHRHDGKFRVLMLASLRDYKGVPEFLWLASSLIQHDDIVFDLVANDDDLDIQRYFYAKQKSDNVIVHRRTDNPAAYYATASLVVNLSRPDQCIETFGLTLLEAMAFGIPVIAPPVGGPQELVDSGVEGYCIDSRDGKALMETVLELSAKPDLCEVLSTNARLRAEQFSPEAFAQNLRNALRF
ncbi:MAG: glycosyltransferase family 4 protein [Porticoccaceae bacterium]|nr:glycosyltransferase family 4 protein [Porticoccaceae bacterium]